MSTTLAMASLLRTSAAARGAATAAPAISAGARLAGAGTATTCAVPIALTWRTAFSTRIRLGANRRRDDGKLRHHRDGNRATQDSFDVPHQWRFIR